MFTSRVYPPPSSKSNLDSIRIRRLMTDDWFSGVSTWGFHIYLTYCKCALTSGVKTWLSITSIILDSFLAPGWMSKLWGTECSDNSLVQWRVCSLKCSAGWRGGIKGKRKRWLQRAALAVPGEAHQIQRSEASKRPTASNGQETTSLGSHSSPTWSSVFHTSISHTWIFNAISRSLCFFFFSLSHCSSLMLICMLARHVSLLLSNIRLFSCQEETKCSVGSWIGEMEIRQQIVKRGCVTVFSQQPHLTYSRNSQLVTYAWLSFIKLQCFLSKCPNNTPTPFPKCQL